MQYKQVAGILIEVIQTPNVPIQVALSAAQATLAILRRSRNLDRTRNGKHSSQTLRRLASDSTSHPETRWKALRTLLAIMAGPHRNTEELRPSEIVP